MGLFYVTLMRQFPRSKPAQRRLIAASVAIASIAAFSFGAIPGRADDSQTGQDVSATHTVTLEILNANLLAVIELLRQRTGAQFIVTGDSRSFRPVNVNVCAPLPQVLDYVAESAGAEVTRDANGVFTIRPEGTPLPSKDLDAQGGSAVTTASATTTRPLAPQHWDKIILNYIEPSYVANMLGGAQDESPYRRIGSTTQAPTVHEIPSQNPIIYEQPINPNGTMSTTPVQPTTGLSVPLNSGAGTHAAESNQFHQVPGTEFGQNPFGAPGGANPGGVGGANAQGTLRPDGITQLVVITDQNALLVRGSSEAIGELRELISKLDVPAKQVEIKVEFVTATIGVINQFGLSFDMIPNPSTEFGWFGTGPQGAGSVFLNYSHGNMVTALAALLTSSKGRVISAPIITATNETPATVQVDIQIPYSQTVTIAQGNGNALQGSTVSFLDVPTGLSVTPRINGDNSVTLQLAPTLSSVGQSPPTGPPPITQQTITTVRTVGNGETLVLGGLVAKTITDSTQEIPIIGELPIIGNLFRTKNNNVSDSELLVFVTPTILPIPGSTTTGENEAPTEGGFGVTP